jgi:hypothetical protein
VELHFSELPAGLALSPSHIDSGREAAELALTAAASTAPCESTVTVTAVSDNLADVRAFGLTGVPGRPTAATRGVVAGPAAPPGNTPGATGPTTRPARRGGSEECKPPARRLFGLKEALHGHAVFSYNLP